ncbi:unnamed protein product [Callosobruchus maculatus]|uniref:Secreted protein n=1 Tax=Callosobruchus maculatus TaxID=64391 RepID=A0A653DK07_CALMS|nr:unnamed protein product [Callosobruchus maculatus]
MFSFPLRSQAGSRAGFSFPWSLFIILLYYTCSCSDMISGNCSLVHRGRPSTRHQLWPSVTSQLHHTARIDSGRVSWRQVYWRTFP